MILLRRKRDLGSGYEERTCDMGRRHGEGSWGSTGEGSGGKGEGEESGNMQSGYREGTRGGDIRNWGGGMEREGIWRGYG